MTGKTIAEIALVAFFCLIALVSIITILVRSGKNIGATITLSRKAADNVRRMAAFERLEPRKYLIRALDLHETIIKHIRTGGTVIFRKADGTETRLSLGE